VDSLDMSEADGWATRVDVGEVIVVVGYSDGCVLRAVIIAMTDKGCLEMLYDR